MNAKSDRNHSSSSILLRFNINTAERLVLLFIGIPFESFVSSISPPPDQLDCIDHLQYYMLYLPRRGCQRGTAHYGKQFGISYTLQVPHALSILINHSFHFPFSVHTNQSSFNSLAHHPCLVVYDATQLTTIRSTNIL